MPIENINNSFITIFTLASFLIFLIALKISSYNYFKFFLDRDFIKPQAFHNKSTPRIGGLASIIALALFISFYNVIYYHSHFDYLYFSITFFILGFLDDVKISLKPFTRLSIMILLLVIGFYLFEIKIEKTGFYFLNNLLEYSFFQYLFLILCFLFIINGTNLTDGFNGLLAIHFILINSVLLYISLNNNDDYFSLFLIGQILVIFCFLLFNFPKAKMFMGDGGAYLFGVVTSLNVINTSISYPSISPLFFTTLLFYLFFEVFFSFIRKIKFKKSPLQPDSMHLHMLVFKYFDKIKGLKNSNPITSVIINFSFVLMVIPALLFRENGLFCRYWFLIQLIIYLFIYLKFYNFTKKLN